MFRTEPIKKYDNGNFLNNRFLQKKKLKKKLYFLHFLNL